METKKEGTLLVVDDNQSILMTLEILLASYFERIVTINSPNLIATTMRENPQIDIVLLDMNFSAGINSGGEGLYWLKEIKNISSDTAVVLFTAYGDIELAVQAMKEGASDFVTKPWDNAKLIVTLRNAIRLRDSERKLKNIEAAQADAPQMIWGRSEAMKRLKETFEKVAPTDANILLTGENGTGKNILAGEIHKLSNRARHIFVPVDMGAVAETLFESELFGHAKGAFTDAKNDRVGKFEAANGGTLFLDEIGNLPLHLQSKLLVALQSRTVTRLGSNRSTPIDIRLITATNRNLEQMAWQETFRQDLLYRLNTITIEVPALRHRREDIIPLSVWFAKRYASKYAKQFEGIAPSAQEKLKSCQWMGNVRELQHTIEKAVIMSGGSELQCSDFALIDRTATNKVAETLEDMERTMIAQAITHHGENLSSAAQSLGITRQTLYNKIKKYGL